MLRQGDSAPSVTESIRVFFYHVAVANLIVAGCDRCGDDRSLNYNCNYCSGSFCTSHRLPENHLCPGLRSANTHGPDFRSTGSSGSSIIGRIFGSSGKEDDAIVREYHPGVKTYDGEINPGEPTSSGMGDVPSNYNPEPSPDVAPDGSIIRNKEAETDRTTGDDAGGIWWTILGALLLPFILLYYAARTLLSILLGVLTRPVPLVLFVAGVAIAAHLFGVIDLPIDAAMSGVGGVLSAAGNTSNATATPQEASSQSGGIDRAEIELYIHEEINEERASRGLGALNWDGELREVARYHSEQMATEGFFAHTSPTGQTMSDRYDKFGYNCRAPTSGNRYLTGAENIAKTYHHKNVIGQGRLTTNREVAEALVQQWMESTGHRENILTPEWNAEGVGVYVTSDNEVYATQNFC